MFGDTFTAVIPRTRCRNVNRPGLVESLFPQNGRTTLYDLETKERVVRLFNERRVEVPTESQAVTLRRLHELTGMPVETMRGWVIKALKNSGDDPGLSSFEREEIKAFRKELAEVKRANEILRTASACFAAAE